MLLAFFVASSSSDPSPKVDLAALGRSLEELCQLKCKEHLRDAGACGLGEGRFCHWVVHVTSHVGHLEMLARELERLTKVEDRATAVEWAMGDAVRGQYEYKLTDEHRISDQLLEHMSSVVMGLVAFNLHDEL